MPYPDIRRRTDLEPELSSLVDLLRNRFAGDITYAVMVLLTEWAEYPQPSFEKYDSALGILSAVDKEFYRTRVAPYEDKKIKENGGIVFSYDLRKDYE